MPTDPLIRLRALCLALPGATEQVAWGESTFRAKKMFATFAGADNHHGAGRLAAWIKASPMNQELLIASDPERFFKPPYVGPSGWIGVWLDRRPPWKQVTSLLEDGYRAVAPKSLLAQLDGKRSRTAKGGTQN